ncbi:MAG TPA: hypothetical protein VNV38_16735 [Stellaceae bacterium]|jgi:hypothetical protein|nr:hypothetical protein [Stellaceae bacterium]
MSKHFAASAILALVLGGCASLQPNEKLPTQPQAPGVELTKEQGGRFIAFVSPKQQHTEPFLGVDDTNYFCLRSWLDNKTGETAHQLYIEDSYYGGPYLWNGVYDTASTKLKLIPISHNQITCDQGCSFADEFAAELPEDYLRAHRDGFAVTFTSSNGKTLAVKVPSDMVTAEINAVDAVKEIAAKVTAHPPAPPTAAPAAPPPATAPVASPAAAPAPAAAAPSPALPAGTVVPPPPKS